MDRLLFLYLMAEYNVENKYLVDDQQQASFKNKIKMEASYNKEQDCFQFELNQSNVLINNKKLEKLTDRIVYKIGSSLYPLKLKVSPLLQIEDINNWDEVYYRWKDCTEKYLQKYNTEQLRQYIRIAEKNFSEKEMFIDALYRDTFMKIYFRNIYTSTVEDEAKLIRWDYFPEGNMNSSYLYQVKKTDLTVHTVGKIIQIIPDMEGTYQMEYKLGTKGEINGISGFIERYYNKKYSKQVTVTSENLKLFDMNYKGLIID